MMNTIPKSESLKSKKLIRLLFTSGKSEFVYPFKMVYHILDTEEKHPALILISVGKKKIKTAVGRNRIKRLFREAYRKNKHPLVKLLQEKKMHIALGFIYVGEQKPEQEFIEKKMVNAIDVLCKCFE